MIGGLHVFRRAATIVAAAVLMAPAQAQWVTFVDETATRLAGVSPTLGAADPEEKDYAWGDFDHDGDSDLAVVRKQPFNSIGKRRAALWMNENGVFHDRTLELASASDVPHDAGFLTPANNRDVTSVDVDNDGFLDLVTAPTRSPNDSKQIGHPRVYHNLGCSGPCDGSNWLGFRFEDFRIPTMFSVEGLATNPCLTTVAAGDVTGDGYADLWLIDDDLAPACRDEFDFDNRLLVNQGVASPGVFIDSTDSHFFGTAADGYYPESNNGASGRVVDLNGDGRLDLIKQYGGHIGAAFNESSPGTPGFFDTYSSPYQVSVYFMNTADLNKDGKLDLIVSDDGRDRYLLNLGNGVDHVADFQTFVYSFSHTGDGGPAMDDGIGGASVSADLDHDGWQDVLITPNDIDLVECDRRLHLYRNLGGTPGESVMLQEQTTGSNCNVLGVNSPNCIVASIPADNLSGAYDVATLDVNGDTWLDLVVGRCSGTQVYINQPQVVAAGAFDPQDVQSALRLGRSREGDIVLSWGSSCAALDTFYNVYAGVLGFYQSHEPLACDHPDQSIEVPPAPGNSYYLVVPTNGTYEGSYGVTSSGAERPRSLAACRDQLVGRCD